MLWNKIRTSLVLQTSFLFFISFIVIILLWVFFYFQQKYQHIEFDRARYFNIASSLQSHLKNGKTIKNADVSMFAMSLSELSLDDDYEVVLQKGDDNKGFTVVSLDSKQLIYVYNDKASILLEDVSTHRSMIVIHLVFTLLLVTQALLYLKLEKSLSPLTTLYNKLKKLKEGDLSPLKMKTQYDEIELMITSYNDSISKIEHVLELREMFNKIFMHEMKMPLAKGMFYLKQKPSSYTHEKLNDILHGLNKELDEFSQIESLIAYQNKIDTSTHSFLDILNEAKNRVMHENKNIELKSCHNCVLVGDKEFWVLCIKNLIDNALKYSIDGKLIIDASDGISFINKGEALPVDISNDVKKWKIDKNKRHKSSTGYGFGLFIIKNIVSLHNYKLNYTYDKNKNEVRLQIKC